MPRIHPTAIVDPMARLADDVEVGAYCIVEADTDIGAGTILRPHAVIKNYTSLGTNNLVDSFAVLGSDPQDLKYRLGTRSYLRIGNNNVFRESVTISRGTDTDTETVIGDGNLFMMCAHVGHNSIVKDECIMVNGSALAGHTVLGRRAVLSAHVAVHQFCWIGECVMSQGNAAASMHVPPYVLFASVNKIIKLNNVGLKRDPLLNDEDRRQIKEAFSLVYRSGLIVSKAMEKMEACTDWGQPASVFRDFIRNVLMAKDPFRRGLAPLRRRGDGDAD